jgi:tetratricopeptide (TPR) repeat protein
MQLPIHSSNVSLTMPGSRTRPQPLCGRIHVQSQKDCPQSPLEVSMDRRSCFLSLLALHSSVLVGAGEALPAKDGLGEIPAAEIDLALAPDQAQYDKYDNELRRAANMIQEGLNASTVEEEEHVWTKIIQEFSSSDAVWRDDIVGRAYGNRGNARSRQGKIQDALDDYNISIKTCPWSVDPVLNRGVLLENIGRFDDAKRDYTAVLKVDPRDPAAWNNLGNACAGAGEYEDAVKYYDKAVRLAPKFSFAAANKALSVYQTGADEEAMREMESLLRRYPDFSDIRAALAAALWASGKQAAAEEAFQRVDDIRYRDVTWLEFERRWPPRLVKEMSDLLQIK